VEEPKSMARQIASDMNGVRLRNSGPSRLNSPEKNDVNRSEILDARA
jgi:hypothetical protein